MNGERVLTLEMETILFCVAHLSISTVRVSSIRAAAFPTMERTLGCVFRARYCSPHTKKQIVAFVRLLKKY